MAGVVELGVWIQERGREGVGRVEVVRGSVVVGVGVGRREMAVGVWVRIAVVIHGGGDLALFSSSSVFFCRCNLSPGVDSFFLLEKR